MSRGLRNNNPLNIRINSDKFQGEIIPSRDKAFKQFESMAYGYRAAFVTLGTYLSKYGRNTIRKIITAWAPPEDNNDTIAYINAVSKYSGISPDHVLTAQDGVLYKLIVAEMSRVENGQRAQFVDVEAGFKLQNKITGK
ncbi:hypothetical protein M2451_002715 [Dysgonomonas sp. PFB1-18]|uniref:structural protein P5 n=1 Tax=unclassified Dysgonomonas TaxID=2630389 RepID=UPI0024747EC7|nr:MULTISPECIES: structural protein P5 [unclassified Dysgonomonas]MDH6309399.1 hypothetical protein [Dysgonomonas sp. PF1-14]MDH6339736.1 hypothetical protein [Dysgonomonas sp. PF1-16]MDH6381384.1 hypothetical protein [Dysgonomonas sp. PFB1-18]MDH6398599.1 hypothetical protein [Dysgonomonas sp. PF1-23]